MNTDIAWLAGLLEGEGCFDFTSRGRRYPRIRLNMNDLDVVERAQKIIGSGSITKREYKNPKWRPTYQLYVGKKSGIEPVLKAILPYMGERRAEAIKEQLAALEKITQRQ